MFCYSEQRANAGTTVRYYDLEPPIVLLVTQICGKVRASFRALFR